MLINVSIFAQIFPKNLGQLLPGYYWNHCPSVIGIGARQKLESLHGWRWNMQVNSKLQGKIEFLPVFHQ